MSKNSLLDSSYYLKRYASDETRSIDGLYQQLEGAVRYREELRMVGQGASPHVQLLTRWIERVRSQLVASGETTKRVWCETTPLDPSELPCDEKVTLVTGRMSLPASTKDTSQVKRDDTLSKIDSIMVPSPAPFGDEWKKAGSKRVLDNIRCEEKHLHRAKRWTLKQKRKARNKAKRQAKRQAEARKRDA